MNDAPLAPQAVRRRAVERCTRSDGAKQSEALARGCSSDQQPPLRADEDRDRDRDPDPDHDPDLDPDHDHDPDLDPDHDLDPDLDPDPDSRCSAERRHPGPPVPSPSRSARREDGPRCGLTDSGG